MAARLVDVPCCIVRAVKRLRLFRQAHGTRDVMTVSRGHFADLRVNDRDGVVRARCCAFAAQHELRGQYKLNSELGVYPPKDSLACLSVVISSTEIEQSLDLVILANYHAQRCSRQDRTGSHVGDGP